MRFTTTALYSAVAIFSAMSSSMATPINVPRAVAPFLLNPSDGDVINQAANVRVDWDSSGFQDGDNAFIRLLFQTDVISNRLIDLDTGSNVIALDKGYVVTTLNDVPISENELGEEKFRIEMEVDGGTVSQTGRFTVQ